MFTTETKVEQYLQVDIDDSISGYVTDWINWVTQYIKNYTEKDFESGAAESRYYDSDGTDLLLIDDVLSVSQVDIIDAQGVSEVEYTLDNTDDYWLYPLNKTTFDRIKLNHAGSRGIFPNGKHRVKVTGVFATSATVPADIEWVATQMVADIIRGSSDVTKGIKSETLGEYSVTFEKAQTIVDKPMYKNILNFYRTPNI